MNRSIWRVRRNSSLGGEYSALYSLFDLYAWEQKQSAIASTSCYGLGCSSCHSREMPLWVWRYEEWWVPVKVDKYANSALLFICLTFIFWGGQNARSVHGLWWEKFSMIAFSVANRGKCRCWMMLCWLFSLDRLIGYGAVDKRFKLEDVRWGMVIIASINSTK